MGAGGHLRVCLPHSEWMGLTWKHSRKAVSLKRANGTSTFTTHSATASQVKATEDQELGQREEENKFAHCARYHLLGVVPCL